MPSFVRSGAAIGVNSQTASSQTRSSITALGGGGFVIAWQTANASQDGSGSAIKLQRYDAQGVAVGAETLVNDLGAGSQVWPRVTSLASGGFVVTWETGDTGQDGYGTAIKARLFDASGGPVGGEFLVNTQSFMDQQQPTITGLADGGFVVAWQTTDTAQDGSGWAVKAQRFSAAGAPVGAEFKVNTTAFGSQNNIDIANLANGGFIVTWQTGNSAGTQINAQAYGADGVKAGAEILVTNGFSSHTAGRVVGLANGGFVVTWMTDNGDGIGIRAQLFDASRNKVGADFIVNPAKVGFDPDVAALADGTFLITWRDSSGGIKGQSYNAAGQRLGGEYTIADSLDADESGAAIAALGNGNFAVSWTHAVAGSASAEDIRLQLLRPNTAPELGGETRSIAVSENGQIVASIAAADADGPSPVSYAIVGGADAARFTINASTGLLRFVAAPNFEAPADAGGDNVYQLIVRASDGELADLQTISVTVTNVNEGVTITSDGGGATAAISIVENVALATQVTAVDVDGTAVTYSISGGADASLFAIDASNGALTFLAAPDFEQAGDADGDSVYLVTVRASDGQWADTQSLSITVGDINEAPVIVSGGGGDEAAVALDENQGWVIGLAAVDPDGTTPQTGIAGGADAALFVIDPSNGMLRFRDLPDFETPRDADGDNVYEVVLGASDGYLFDYQTVLVTVGNVYEGLRFAEPSASFSVDENTGDVGSVSATGEAGAAIVYTLAGGADQSLFDIDPLTGRLSFVVLPDFDVPGDADGNNIYEVVVRASDGIASATQSVTVDVGNVDEAIEIFSYGGADTVSMGMAENGSMVADVEAWDPDFEPIVFAIAGGADAGLFAIDAGSGALSFIDRPDFEAPGDADGDNVYDVVVTASSLTSSDSQAFAVAISNQNEGIFITSNGGGTSASLSILEGDSHVTTVVAHDPDGTIPVYSIVGGPDAAAFTIDPQTGVLTFVETPDHEAPADSAGANFYTVQVAASDGEFTPWQSVQIFVGNVDEPVTVTSHAGAEHVALSVGENSLAVTQVVAADADGGPVSYAISGGEDAALFTIDAETGALSFIAGPDFEAPGDADGDNVYAVAVTATDGAFTDSQSFAVTVGGVDEAVAISSNGGGASAAVTRSENGVAVTIVAAADPDGGTVTYAIAGGADAARFTIDASTGALAFVSAPDFESPADAGADNVYDVIISASDGGTTDSQAIAVTIGNVDEPVAITSNGGGASAAVSMSENVSAVTTVAATDADGGAVTYSIVGGADAARFTIDAATGALAFISAPDFEAPADADANNVYDVTVSASDGTFTDSQAIAVAVGNVNEPVVISSNGGGANAAVAVSENTTFVATVVATDADGGGVTYAIAGGADAARFTIDASTGALSFIAAPNFEAPADSGANNVYDVIVSASDGVLTDSQAVAVSVGNVDEPVVIGSNGGGANAAVAVSENGSSVTIVAATDADGGAVTYAIAGGADAARFMIDAATGALAFAVTPNFEAPADAGSDNVYDVTVSASDGTFSDTQALAVTVINVLEGNVITGTGSADTIATTKTVAGQPFATAFEDTIYGLGGADTLMGGGGADIIDGGSGNDLIYGDAGVDRLTGGIGADRFALKLTTDSQVGAPDLITDFNRSQADRIGLADIDARTNAGGNNSFTFIGTAAFSGVSGQLRYEQTGGSTFVTGDVDGDRIADFQIQLQGLIALTSADFIL